MEEFESLKELAKDPANGSEIYRRVVEAKPHLAEVM